MPLLGKYNVRHFKVSLYPRRAFQLLRDLPRLKYIVQSEQPEIIHAHMVTNAVLMRLGRSLAGFGNYGLVTDETPLGGPSGMLVQDQPRC